MTLGPEMQAEGWLDIGAMGRDADDPDRRRHYMWLHEPSHRCVTLVETPRRNWVGPVWGPEPASKDVMGYDVCCTIRDDGGCPIEGDGFWTESLALALKTAREMRRHVLGERPPVSRAEQLTLDDALAASGGAR